MIIKTEDYSIDSTQLNICKISGTLRLPSPLSYEEPFSPIKDAIHLATDTLTIDITELEYLNSSGITSLARIIILGKKLDKPITLTINTDIPWQSRSLSSLKNLWEKFSINAQ